MMVLFIVFIERSQRRLLIQYPKRQQGNRMVGGESSFLPLKVNSAGVIPPIFASSLLMLPQTMASMNNAAGAAAQAGWWGETLGFINAYLGVGQPLHVVLFAALIIFFCFFYTGIVFNAEETAENLRKYGGFIPGYRPGKRTAEYFDYVLTRLTVIGSVYIAAVCVLPELLRNNPLTGQVLYRRHVAADRRLRHHGHRRADPVAPDRPPVRRHDQEGEVGGKKK